MRSSIYEIEAIYPSSKGMFQSMWRYLFTELFKALEEEKLKFHHYIHCDNLDMHAALKTIHFPKTEAEITQILEKRHPLQTYLIKEEIVALQAVYERSKKKIVADEGLAYPYKQSNLLQSFINNLPFPLTNGQMSAIQDIQKDMAQKNPMWRLVQGDVGSGKTVVAAAAAALCLEAGHQVAIMSPTDILAKQHYYNFHRWFAEKIGEDRIIFLGGSMKSKEKKEALKKIKEGVAHCIVGTHSLFQDEVEFYNLHLVIIDEQHRFGVDQRLRLKEKSNKNQNVAHQLVLTATPIPRTLQQSFQGQIHTSILKELPSGRKPIKTTKHSQEMRNKIMKKIGAIAQRKVTSIDVTAVEGNEEKTIMDDFFGIKTSGAQVYWVCNLIDSNEDEEIGDNSFEEKQKKEKKAIYETIDEITPFAKNSVIEALHGKMKNEEKITIMERFRNHQIDILVCTTVIEVGVDVPNASIIVIDNAENLGLAQLHQLRGRVGRGSKESFCLLLYGEKISKNAWIRLDTMCQSNDGFVLAKKDLWIRGAGEIHGENQSGTITMKFSDPEENEATWESAQSIIQHLEEKEKNNLIQRWFPQSQDRLAS
jgi:ATP-dependent DNA helicase RecG